MGVTIERALTVAIAIANEAHHHQNDKGGNAYILHPLRVMLWAKPEDRIVAVLHDVVEDTPVTLKDLAKRPFAEEDLEAIDALTRRKGEAYENFIARICGNPKAMRVKLLDIKDNMDTSRLPGDCLTPRDDERMKRYMWARDTIREFSERGAR